MKHFALSEEEYAKAWKAALVQEREEDKSVEVLGGLMGRIARLMAKDGRERTTQDVARCLGYPDLDTRSSKYKCVTNALASLRKMGRVTSVTLGDGISHAVIWKAAPREPHVSCADRIAAAVKEATK